MIYGHEALTPDMYLPESIMRMYPYGLATGSDIIYPHSELTLFHGDDYDSLPVYGADGILIWTPPFAFGGFDLFRDVGNFVNNAVNSAGKEIGKVSHSIQDAAGAISKEIKKVPVIGAPLATVFDITYHSTLGPAQMTVAIVIEGKKIDQAVLDDIKQTMKEFKEIAPYAQMVIAFIPGIGPVASAAISAGLALAEGQPIEEVIKAGLIGAIPGGPLVKAAVEVGITTIQHVAKGEKVDLGTIAQTAAGAAGSALGLPPAAKNALMGGVSIIGGIANGKPLDKAVTDGVIKALPVSDTVKNAMTEATAITIDLAHGKKVDTVLLSHISNVTNMLPVGDTLKDSLKTGVDTMKKVAEGKKAEDIIFAAVQSGIGDKLVAMGASKLPPDAQKAIKSGIAVGTGATTQVKRAEQLVNKIPGKLIQSGIDLAKSHPLFGEARKLAAKQGGTKGFDIGSGLMQAKSGLFDVATVRNSLKNAADKLGFDMACAVRVGAVTNPKPGTVSAVAHAGFAITKGMQGYVPTKKQVMMSVISQVPSAAAGATAAVKQVASMRSNQDRHGRPPIR